MNAVWGEGGGGREGGEERERERGREDDCNALYCSRLDLLRCVISVYLLLFVSFTSVTITRLCV